MTAADTRTPIEPLHPRELEILSLLEHNLSDREIAAHLHLSATTIKWYNRQIFQKLGVENRKQAVERASALGVFIGRDGSSIRKHNLPNPLTPFVGRVSELEEIAEWLRDPHSRLLTLVAPGGMGKSRLAIAAAERALTRFPDGVFFVPLAPIAKPDDVVGAVAAQVGVPRIASERSVLQQLCDYLAPRNLLIVLDNFEHVYDASVTIPVMLEAAPHLKLVVTSRERLNLSIETALAVQGLHYPDTESDDQVSDFDAMQLFMQSALCSNPHFGASPADVVQICRLVQGMPLAIELAAAWARSMTAREIAHEIQRSVDFLRTDARDVPVRMRSIRAVFEASWAQLDASERAVFAGLSVFRGGCTREAAQEVTGSTAYALDSLIGKALIWRSSKSGRLNIHELLRQYAEQELIASDQSKTVYTAHREYYARHSAKWSRSLFDDQLNALDQLDREYDNLVTTFLAAIQSSSPEAILPYAGLWYYFSVRGKLAEGARLFDAAIEAIEGHDSISLGRLLVGRAHIAGEIWDYETRQRCAIRGVDVVRRLGDTAALPLALAEYSSAVIPEDHGRALGLCREGYGVSESLGDLFGMIRLGNLIAYHLRKLGNLSEARSWLERSHAMATSVNNASARATMYAGLYALAAEQGDFRTARDMLEQCLAYAKEVKYTMQVQAAYSNLVGVSLLLGDVAGAKRYANELLVLARDTDRSPKKIAAILLVVAEVCAEDNDLTQAAANLRDAYSLVPTCSGPVGACLTEGGVLLLKAGRLELAAEVLYVAMSHQTDGAMESCYRNRYVSYLEDLRRQLGDARYEEIVEAASKKSLDELHAELYAILNSPPFVQ